MVDYHRDKDSDEGEDSNRFTSPSTSKKRPRQLQINRTFVEDDDEKESNAIPPPMRLISPINKQPLATPRKPTKIPVNPAPILLSPAGSSSSSSSSSVLSSLRVRTVGSASSSSSSAARRRSKGSSSERVEQQQQRVGRSSSSTKDTMSKINSDTQNPNYDLNNTTVSNNYRPRSRSQSPHDHTPGITKVERTENADTSSGSSSSSTSSEDEMYKKYRKYLSNNNDEEQDAPWRNTNKDSPLKKIGAPPPLEYSYQNRNKAKMTESLSTPKHPSSSKSSGKKSKDSPPKEKLMSDRISEEDLKTVEFMLFGSSDDEDESSTEAGGGGGSSSHDLLAIRTVTEDDLPDAIPGRNKRNIEDDDDDGEEEIITTFADAPVTSAESSAQSSSSNNIQPSNLEQAQKREAGVVLLKSGKVKINEEADTNEGDRVQQKVNEKEPLSKGLAPRVDTVVAPPTVPTPYGNDTGSSSDHSASTKSRSSTSKRGDALAVVAGTAAVGVAVGAAVAPNQDGSVEPTMVNSQTKTASVERKSVQDKIIQLETKCNVPRQSTLEKKQEEEFVPLLAKKSVSREPSIIEDVTESVEGDLFVMWEKSVMDESNDVLEESFGQASRRRGMNSSGRSSLGSKSSKRRKSPNDSLTQSDEHSQSKQSFGDSLSFQRESDTDSLPVAPMDRMEDSRGSLSQIVQSASVKMAFEDDVERGGDEGNSVSPMPARPRERGRMEVSLSQSQESFQFQELHSEPVAPSCQDEGSLLDNLEPMAVEGIMAMLEEKDDNDPSDSEFSLRASQDISRMIDAGSISETSANDYERIKSYDGGFMNQALRDLEATDSISAREVENFLDEPSENSGSRTSTVNSQRKDSNSILTPPSRSLGFSHHILRASVVMLLLATVALPTYFLVWYDSSDNSPQPQETSPPLFPSLPSARPAAAPVAAPSNVLVPLPTDGLSSLLPSMEPALLPTRPSGPPFFSSPVAPPPSQTISPSGSSTPIVAEGLREFLVSNWPSLEDDLVGNTPQFFAFDWLANDSNLASKSEQQILQRFSLATLFFSTGGEKWLRNDRWLSADNECLWYSSINTLPCDEELAFTSLNLDLNDLAGTIPSELALLSNSLTRISLPSRDTNSATLTGTIPNELGFLSLLEFVDLSGNNLQGSLPVGVGKWNLVRSFDLRNNQLWGSFPYSIIHWTTLVSLDLGNNEMDSSIPTEIGFLTSLRSLNLSRNSFTGAVPSEIGRLNLLQRLYLDGNQFVDLPTEIGQLILLRELYANENKVTGSVPTEIGNLVNLLDLNLSQNFMAGNLPSELGNLIAIRDLLDLSGNLFSGSLPSELGKLIFLRNLMLNSNQLTGIVPVSFANLDRLVTLRLEDNNLTGTVPDQVCAVYGRTFPVFVTDCLDSEIVCKCCMFCCESEGGCECQFAGTELSFLCSEFTESPGLEQRMFGNIS